MRKIQITILGDVEDSSADFIEVAFGEVATPPAGGRIGLVVSRYHATDRWLTSTGWSSRPPVEQLPVAIASRVGSTPIVLKLPVAWTRFIDPFERINMVCSILDAEGVVAWQYTGAILPPARTDNSPEAIELPPEPEPSDVIAEEPVDEAADEVIEEHIGESEEREPEEHVSEVDPPTIGGPPIDDEEPPIGGGSGGADESMKKFPWLLVAAAAAVLVISPVVYIWANHEVQPPAPPSQESTPDEQAQQAQAEVAANNCAKAEELAREAARRGSGLGEFVMGEAYDPSRPDYTYCIANQWDAISALGYYERACAKDVPEASASARRLIAWIEEELAKGETPNTTNLRIAQQSVPDVKATCKL